MARPAAGHSRLDFLRQGQGQLFIAPLRLGTEGRRVGCGVSLGGGGVVTQPCVPEFQRQCGGTNSARN